MKEIVYVLPASTGSIKELEFNILIEEMNAIEEPKYIMLGIELYS